jgi:hypothetical protein
VQALEQVADLLKLDLNDFFLSDFKQEEFGRSVGFLDAFLLQHITAESFVPAFLVGSAPLSALGREPVRVQLPIVLNLKSKGVIIWIRARATLIDRAGNTPSSAPNGKMS